MEDETKGHAKGENSTNQVVGADTNVSLVNFPEKENKTNMLLERQMVIFQPRESRAPCILIEENKPKSDPITHLVNPTMEEELDCFTAQPLLQTADNDMVCDSPWLLPCKNLIGGSSASNVITLPLPEEVYHAPLSEFPPLEPGNTRKLRNSFESRPLLNAQPPPGTTKSREGSKQGNTGDIPGVDASTKSGLPEAPRRAVEKPKGTEVPRTRNNPWTMADVLRDNSNATPNPKEPHVFEPAKI